MRLIDGDALGNEFRQRFGAWYSDYSTISMGEVLRAIDDAPTVLQWVSVGDRLPEAYQRVIICAQHKEEKCPPEYYLTLFDGNIWWLFAKQGYEITHWMPLPLLTERSEE